MNVELALIAAVTSFCPSLYRRQAVGWCSWEEISIQFYFLYSSPPSYLLYYGWSESLRNKNRRRKWRLFQAHNCCFPRAFGEDELMPERWWWSEQKKDAKERESRTDTLFPRFVRSSFFPILSAVEKWPYSKQKKREKKRKALIRVFLCFHFSAPRSRI